MGPHGDPMGPMGPCPPCSLWHGHGPCGHHPWVLIGTRWGPHGSPLGTHEVPARSPWIPWGPVPWAPWPPLGLHGDMGWGCPAPPMAQWIPWEPHGSPWGRDRDPTGRPCTPHGSHGSPWIPWGSQPLKSRMFNDELTKTRQRFFVPITLALVI